MAPPHPVATQPPPMRTLFDGTTYFPVPQLENNHRGSTGLGLRQPHPSAEMDLCERQPCGPGSEATRPLFRVRGVATIGCYGVHCVPRHAIRRQHHCHGGPPGPIQAEETSLGMRFESQLAKADKLGVEDRDKIELLQMALHIDFDARSRMTKIPSDDYAGAVAAYKDGLASDCANLTPRQRWIYVNDSLADRVQKRLAHYFESGEPRR
ncbi:hypothetical protein E4U24_002998 [Claviceps purpurea]|nr:hypothetical protein E4U24_002998 [Claviceps purpurea]